MKNALKNCVIGFGYKYRFEVIGDSSLKIKPLPLVLKEENVHQVKLLITTDGQLMVFLGSKDLCYIYKERTWHFHSSFKEYPFLMIQSAHTLAKGMHVYGIGQYLYMKNGTSCWIPKLVKDLGSGIPFSENEIIALKGHLTKLKYKIHKFNFDTNEFVDFCTLKVPRRNPALCIFKDKLFVTGGFSSNYTALKSTEIIPMSGCNESKFAADLNVARAAPGMAVLRLDGCKQTLIAFGGCDDSRVEEWCEEKEKWIFSELKLSNARAIWNYCYTPTLSY